MLTYEDEYGTELRQGMALQNYLTQALSPTTSLGQWSSMRLVTEPQHLKRLKVKGPFSKDPFAKEEVRDKSGRVIKTIYYPYYKESTRKQVLESLKLGERGIHTTPGAPPPEFRP